MAQPPQPNTTSRTSETVSNSEGDRKGPVGASQGSVTENSIRSAITSSAQHSGETAQEAARASGDILRQSGAAGAEAA
jgi:hypothetical protein